MREGREMTCSVWCEKLVGAEGYCPLARQRRWQVFCSGLEHWENLAIHDSDSVFACCAQFIISVLFFAICLWMKCSRSGIPLRKPKYSTAWTLSVEAWKLGLDWYGSSTLHAVASWIRSYRASLSTRAKHTPQPFIPLQVILSNFLWGQLVGRRCLRKKSNKYSISL